MLVVVVYDVSDDKRRLKLSHLLEGYGRRVQYSVFECFIGLEEMRQLYQRICKLMKDEDSVRLYWISKDAVSRVLTLGSPPPQEPPSSYIL
jgi:CRISPR-associated protein Cas2